MQEYPESLQEFEEKFSNDQKCLEYLKKIRWGNGFSCPRCGFGRGWKETRGLIECGKCHYQTSVLAGTIFQDTKKPLTLWFRAIWHITSQKYGANALGIQRVLGLGSYRTAWSWLHKFRRAMVRPGRDKLSETIEVDETYVGGTKAGKRGRGAAGKTLVLIAVQLREKQVDQQQIGRIRLKIISEASSQQLNTALEQCVVSGSTIRTDGWKGYSQLPSLGFQHEVVQQTEDIGKNLLPTCHRVAALLKRWLLGTLQGGVSRAHLEYYLDEFVFRFNRRTSKSRGKLFYRLLEQAVLVPPSPYKSMIKQTGRGKRKSRNHNI